MKIIYIKDLKLIFFIEKRKKKLSNRNVILILLILLFFIYGRDYMALKIYKSPITTVLFKKIIVLSLIIINNKEDLSNSFGGLF